MNNILSKILCGTFIVFAIIISFAATAGFSDTTQLLANNAAVNSSSPIFKTVVKLANIEFPACIAEQKDASLDYVEKFCNKKREFIIHSYQQGKNFFSKAATILKQYHLPQELKVLLALESGFDPNVVSPAGAVGYWQIMAEAARDYGLKISGQKSVGAKNITLDERKNFNKSTIAVAKFFTEGCKNLNNNILLMVAAYNCGIGTMRSAIRRSGKTNPDFWDIKKSLPAETRNYVMNFIALSVVFNNYDNFLKRQLTFAPQTTEVVIMPEVVKPVISAD